MLLVDLVFLTLLTVGAASLVIAVLLAIRGQRTRATRVLRRLALGAAVYMAIVALASLFLPQQKLQVGEMLCWDDWCIGVQEALRTPAHDEVSYAMTFRLSCRARRVTQRERNVAVYLSDGRGLRYDPLQVEPEPPFNTALAPGESITTKRIFEVPTDARVLGAVLTHEGGFPIQWFIVGYESWFRKPTIVLLP